MKIIYFTTGFLFLCICACDVVQKKDLELITEPKKNVVKVDSVELLDTVPHVKIGSQVWMANNVSITTLSDGRPIKVVKSIKEWIKYNERNMPVCFVAKNGTCVYNGLVLLDSISICPAGYRLPETDDYLMLAAYLGGLECFSEKVTVKLANYEWKVEDWNESAQQLYDRTIVGNNKSGFNAEKGTAIINDEIKVGDFSVFWIGTPADSTNKQLKALYFGNGAADINQGISNFNLQNGFAIRCIRK